MSFFSNLFYKQKPKPAPKFPSRRRIYLPEKSLIWDEDYVKSSKFERDMIDLGVKVSQGTRTLDFRNVIISGTKLPRKKDKQDERALRLRIALPKWDLINSVFEDIPGGLYVTSVSTTFERCYFTDIGEDAISTPISTGPSNHYCGLRLLKCNFYNSSEKDGGDKSIQLNNAHGCFIRECFITGGITGMRLGESRDSQKSLVTVERNTFDNVSTAINASGTLTVSHGGNTYNNVKKQIQKGSKVTY